MSAAQVLRQAEALKAAVQDTSRGANEAWVSRQKLQDLYQKLLVMDLEYALDKKVEQDLWNHAFKNQINTLQGQTKDKQNPKRVEIQSSLNLFLETASGFYLQLLQELCSAFKLDLPFRRKSASIGIIKEYGPVANKVRVPKKSSCLYICQHCLVHLGDIARYRHQVDQAQTYYRHAARLVPYNGQPYNQLAILEAAKGNKLATVFYYIRSIAVRHPFPVATTNLEKFYSKISRDVLKVQGKLSMSEIVSALLQFHAFVHQCNELDKAKYLCDKLLLSLPTHVTSMSFSAHQLVQVTAINLCSLFHTKRKLDSSQTETDTAKDEEGGAKSEPLSTDEQACYDLVLDFLVSLLDLLLYHTPKQETKAKEYHTLPALKVLLDWLRVDHHLLSHATFCKNGGLWLNLSKLLNNIQFHANQKDTPIELKKYTAMPLPEDSDLQCFLPLQKSHSEMDFSLMPMDGLSTELEMRLRCHRLIEAGIWICDEFPSLNVLNVQKLKSGRLQFSAPTAHIKMVTGTDGEVPAERQSYRQNVAIQAIMQKKAKQANNTQNKPTDETPSKKTLPDKPSQSDAGVSTETPSERMPGKETPNDLERPRLDLESAHPSEGIDQSLLVLEEKSPVGEVSNVGMAAPAMMHGLPFQAVSLYPVHPSQPQQAPVGHSPGKQVQQGSPVQPRQSDRTPGKSPVKTDQPQHGDRPHPFGYFPCPVGSPSERPTTNASLSTPPRGTHVTGSDGFGNFTTPDGSSSTPKGDPRINPNNQRWTNLDSLPPNVAQLFNNPFLAQPGGALAPGHGEPRGPFTSSPRQQRPPPQPPRAPHQARSPMFAQGQGHGPDQQDPAPNFADLSQLVAALGNQNQPGIDLSSLFQAATLAQAQAALSAQQVSPRSQMPSQKPLHQEQLRQHLAPSPNPHHQDSRETLAPRPNQEPYFRQGPMQQHHTRHVDNFMANNRYGIDGLSGQQLGGRQPPPDMAYGTRNPLSSSPGGGFPSARFVEAQSQLQGQNQMPNMGPRLMYNFSGQPDFAAGPQGFPQPTGAQNTERAKNSKNAEIEESEEEEDFFSRHKRQESFGRPDDALAGGVKMPELTSINLQSEPDSMLSTSFPTTSGMAVSFPLGNEDVPPPTNSPSGPASISSLFSAPEDVGQDVANTSTYSLFSQSPWSVSITGSQSHSHSSSPFGSSSSSMRTTPDPFAPSTTPPQERPASTGYGRAYGYGGGGSGDRGSVPRPQQGGDGTRWMEDSHNRSPIQEMVVTPGGNGAPAGMLHNNIQSLWSAGPSPLEKLLEQQRHQRHGDPH